MKAKPWGEAHRREARIACRRLADEADLSGNPKAARALSDLASDGASVDEGTFRYLLGTVGYNLTPARIDREVRRVRGLAEGRIVREAGYYVRTKWGTPQGPYDMRTDAVDVARAKRRSGIVGVYVVHVSRIRRAP